MQPRRLDSSGRRSNVLRPPFEAESADSIRDRACAYPSDVATEQAAQSNVTSRRTRRPRGPLRRVFLCLGIVVLGIFVWLTASFSVYMLRPSSMNFSEKSAEWVRTLPFGNWAVDEAEHIYYSDHAPKKGGPQLTKLPSVGLSQIRRSRVANATGTHHRRAPGRRPSHRSSRRHCPAKACGGVRAFRPGKAAGTRDYVPT